MNHLEEAILAYHNSYQTEHDHEKLMRKLDCIGNALIAIAEQLEKIAHKGNDGWYCYECLDIHYDDCPKEDK